jgi:hypothetical protein
MIFTKIIEVELPKRPLLGKGFTVAMLTDGDVPFPQMIVRQGDVEYFIKDENVTRKGKNRYQFKVAPECYNVGTVQIQIEGCKNADIINASSDDWVKEFHSIEVKKPNPKKKQTSYQTTQEQTTPTTKPKSKPRKTK